MHSKLKVPPPPGFVTRTPHPLFVCSSPGVEQCDGWDHSEEAVSPWTVRGLTDLPMTRGPRDLSLTGAQFFIFVEAVTQRWSQQTVKPHFWSPQPPRSLCGGCLPGGLRTEALRGFRTSHFARHTAHIRLHSAWLVCFDGLSLQFEP